MNIMRENIKLIKMISDLRLKVKELVSKEKNTRTIAKMRANQSSMMNQSKEEGGPAGGEELTDQEKDQQRLELEQKRQTIDQYRRHINELHQEQEQLLQEQAYFQQMQA